ncbi:MAG: hypothetical protein ACK58T_34390, partial [Phycisphaerae bacterium]
MMLVSVSVSSFLNKPIVAAEKAVEEGPSSDAPAFTATHKQARFIRPTDPSGAPVSLNTFCLDSDGNILACVSNHNPLVPVVVEQKEQGETATHQVTAAGLLQV